MAEHITIRKASGTWVVRAQGAVIGESNRALGLSEGSYDEVIYFPREDLAMAFLEASEKVTHCPHKGDATYFSVVGKSGTLRDAAWTYESPFDGVAEIAGHIAFMPNEAVLVEEV